ncbi:MAG: DEAD/DEAH box helicase [Actinomycetes bacterium]
MSPRPAGPTLASFRAGYPFALDGFQLRAAQALEAGNGVLVAAPTGAGKTVVGEFAVFLALAEGRKCFYTTPIKALSNQKYADLVARHGAHQVGLLTGDNTVNGEAPIVVMTTEVLRNMLYASSPTLGGLGYVVMDEVHYLSDRTRGAVWEEVIINLPESVLLVCLSATVSNAEEFGDWLVAVRGHTSVVVEERRPVPLWQHVMVGDRLHDLFVHGADADRATVNPELVTVAAEAAREHEAGGYRPARGARRPRRRYLPSRPEVIDRLEHEGLLPGIVFVFSRVGADAAVTSCRRAGLRLTTPEQRQEIRARVLDRCAELADEDLDVLGYYEWLDGLERGIAAHHAGLLPTFKETVEDLFSRGLVRVVFATETLALGINMPARSVVLERLVKWNGQAHAALTPGEYTQLTGRAGRRGIDVEGHAVVLWHDGLDPRAVAGLASTRTYPLRSSFRPSYNMTVNLVAAMGRPRARELLESSFAQFQADRAVVGIARQLRRDEDILAGYLEAMTCHLGEFTEYAALRRALRAREADVYRTGSAQRRSTATASLDRLRRGDVILVPAGRRSGLAVILDADLPPAGRRHGGSGPRPRVLTADRQVRRLSILDFPEPVNALGHLTVPTAFNPRSAQARRDLAARLVELRPSLPAAVGRPARSGHPRRSGARDQDGADRELAAGRRSVRTHPCHVCPDRDEHARWAERYDHLRGESDQLAQRVERRTNTVARQFDRVAAVLDQLGYLEADRVTEQGRMLARLYSELDLVAAECLRTGVFDDLPPAHLAACASVLAFETRRLDDAESPRLPPEPSPTALEQVRRTWVRLTQVEHEHGLSFLREPDLGFAWGSYRWASGADLATVLSGTGLSAGDFVRSTRSLVDLLGQLAEAAGERSPVGRSAREAVRGLRRGVVAAGSVS